jgi:hypothetical protein
MQIGGKTANKYDTLIHFLQSFADIIVPLASTCIVTHTVPILFSSEAKLVNRWLVSDSKSLTPHIRSATELVALNPCHATVGPIDRNRQ